MSERDKLTMLILGFRQYIYDMPEPLVPDAARILAEAEAKLKEVAHGVEAERQAV